MALKYQTCVIPTCDTCGGGWGDEGDWHFDSVNEALAQLPKLEWLVNGEQLMCPDCALKADCAVTCHQYGPWEEFNTFRRRRCEHCDDVEFDPPYEQLAIDVNLDSEGGPN
jgi:hypothetical protein